MEGRPVRCPECGRPFSGGGNLYTRHSLRLVAWHAECINCDWHKTIGPYFKHVADPTYLLASPKLAR